MANTKQDERALIYEEVRKAQSRLNRIAGTAVLSDQDNALFTALTVWQRAELARQLAPLADAN